MNRLKENKLNNKGFSLVELIIVIAIMAVLIGVLAPQYLKYVEKSRKSSDLDNVDQMISAVEIYSADPDHTIVSGKIVYAAGSCTTLDTAVANALNDAGLPSTTATMPTMKSNTYAAWTIEFSSTGVTITGNADLKTDLGR